MRAGDRDEPSQRAELGEQLAAVEYSLLALASQHELGVVVGDRRGDDHLGVGRDVGRVVTDARLEAGLP